MSNTEEGNIFSAISDVNMALFEKKQPLNFGCGICYEDLIGNTTKKECGHVFHDKCILKKLANGERLCYHGKGYSSPSPEKFFFICCLIFFHPLYLTILAEWSGFIKFAPRTYLYNMSNVFSAAKNFDQDNYFDQNITF